MHSAFWQLGKILIRELFLGLQTMDKCVHLVAGDSAESFLITPRPLLSRSWAVVPSSTTRLITLTTLANIIINQITITALVVNHSPYHSLSPLTALTRQHHHQQDHHHRRLHKKKFRKTSYANSGELIKLFHKCKRVLEWHFARCPIFG